VNGTATPRICRRETPCPDRTKIKRDVSRGATGCFGLLPFAAAPGIAAARPSGPEITIHPADGDPRRSEDLAVLMLIENFR
jgi:hypothetical protein